MQHTSSFNTHFASLVSNSSLVVDLPPVRHSTPTLVLSRQESRVTELISDAGGVQREAHIVIKGQPFCVTLGLKDCPQLNFHSIRLEASLLYDSNRDQVVPMEGGCPLQFSSEVLSSGGQVKMSMKVKVLSSHYAGQYFVVRVRGLNPTTNQLYPGLQLDTLPIRVVSKPSSCVPTNLRGKRGQPSANSGSSTSSASVVASVPIAASSSVAVSSAANSQLLTKVNEILETQQRLLQLVGNNNTGEMAHKSTTPFLKRKRGAAKKMTVKDEEEDNDGDSDCVSSFRQFASLYEATPGEQRVSKLRKITEEFPELIKEMLGSLTTSMTNAPTTPAQPPEPERDCESEARVASQQFADFLSWGTMFGSEEGADIEFMKTRYCDPEAINDLNDTFDAWLKEM